MARGASRDCAGYSKATFAMKSLWRWTWRILALLFVLLLFYQGWIFAHVWWWVDHNPSTSAFMEDRLEDFAKQKSRCRTAT